MSITPLALYQLWLDDGDQPFNVQKASSDILLSMVKSRFIGRVIISPQSSILGKLTSQQEQGLLQLDRGFHDLADRTLIRQLKYDRLALEHFTRYGKNICSPEMRDLMKPSSKVPPDEIKDCPSTMDLAGVIVCPAMDTGERLKETAAGFPSFDLENEMRLKI